MRQRSKQLEFGAEGSQESCSTDQSAVTVPAAAVYRNMSSIPPIILTQACCLLQTSDCSRVENHIAELLKLQDICELPEIRRHPSSGSQADDQRVDESGHDLKAADQAGTRSVGGVVLVLVFLALLCHYFVF